MKQFLQISCSLAFDTCGHATMINENLCLSWTVDVMLCVYSFICTMHDGVQRHLDRQATAQMASVTMPDSEIVLTLQMSEPLLPRCWLQPGDEAFQGVQMGPRGQDLVCRVTLCLHFMSFVCKSPHSSPVLDP